MLIYLTAVFAFVAFVGDMARGNFLVGALELLIMLLALWVLHRVGWR